MSDAEQERLALTLAQQFLLDLSSGAEKGVSTTTRERARRIARHFPIAPGDRCLAYAGHEWRLWTESLAPVPWPVLEKSDGGTVQRLAVEATPIRSEWQPTSDGWSQGAVESVIRGLRHWGDIVSTGVANATRSALFADWWTTATDAALSRWLVRAAPPSQEGLAEAIAAPGERWTTEQIAAALGAGGPEQWLIALDRWQNGVDRERIAEAIRLRWDVVGDAATWLLTEGGDDPALIEAIVAGFANDVLVALEASGLVSSGWAWWDGRLAIVLEDDRPGWSTFSQADDERALEQITLLRTDILGPDAENRWATRVRDAAQRWPEYPHTS